MNALSPTSNTYSTLPVTRYLLARPRRWYSWDFTVWDGDNLVADIDFAHIREKGDVEIDGMVCRMYRDGFLGDFVLEAQGHILLRAQKPSAFVRSFDLTYDHKHYQLKAASPFRRRFVLIEGNAIIGTIYPVSLFTRRAILDLPEEMPLVVRVFILWLVLLLWRRDANSG